jgi:predicted nucleic acid-binding protein
MAVTGEGGHEGDRNHWLIDKLALARLGRSAQADEWALWIERGLVRITTVTLLEVGNCARSASDLRVELHSPPISAMPVGYLTPTIEDRAVMVLTSLADRRQHRTPSVPDLLIAATAELSGLIVLHLDKDFEVIAEITGQPVERLMVSAT